jgi:Ino eighty subunit 1
MQNQSNNNNAESRQTAGLYVIFRVFNLGIDSVGLKVLVDPESMRQRGELAFTAETWSVVTAG